jgi:hypothetical protein
VEKQKKEDSALADMRKTVADLMTEVKEHPEYVAIKEQLEAKHEELLTEELGEWKEKCKDLSSGYRDEIKRLQGMFHVAMEELDVRKGKGLVLKHGE